MLKATKLRSNHQSRIFLHATAKNLQEPAKNLQERQTADHFGSPCVPAGLQ